MPLPHFEKSSVGTGVLAGVDAFVEVFTVEFVVVVVSLVDEVFGLLEIGELLPELVDVDGASTEGAD